MMSYAIDNQQVFYVTAKQNNPLVPVFKDERKSIRKNIDCLRQNKI